MKKIHVLYELDIATLDAPYLIVSDFDDGTYLGTPTYGETFGVYPKLRVIRPKGPYVLSDANRIAWIREG